MGKYSAARDLDLAVRKRWYLIANRACARIYQERPGGVFEQVMALENPELKPDPSGWTAVQGPNQDPARDEAFARRFAIEIGKRLGLSAHHEEFRDLVVAAEPHFLGLLRSAMPTPAQNRLISEINRELVEFPEKELFAYLHEKVA